MEQTVERLLAEIKVQMKACQEEMKALMDANTEGLNTSDGRLRMT
jgi:hypothetical protein